MSAVLVIAHGSRVTRSNNEVQVWVERFHDATPGVSVALGFLELATPTMDDGLTALMEQGHRKIFVLPYFLAAGRHVETDIPAFVEQQLSRYPDLEIRVLPHLGAYEGLVAMGAELVQTQIEL